MQSLYFFKGYGKLANPPEYQQQQHAKRRRIVLAAASAICLTVIIAAMIGALVLDSALEPEDEDEDQPPANANANAATDFAEALKTVCAVTEHLDSCIDSISSINDPPRSDPVHFFNLSLQVAIREAANLSALPRALIYKSGNPRAESAMKDCVILFDDSLSHVTRSAEMTKPRNPGEELLSETKIRDIQTWIGAAMTDQETCLDGLDEMGSTAVDEVRPRVRQCSEFMSNSLAILNNLRDLVGKFGLTMP